MVVVPVPDAAPVTIPEVPTVATEALLLVQVPPGVALVSAVVLPLHTLNTPAMPDTLDAATVISCVAAIVPQLFVTV